VLDCRKAGAAGCWRCSRGGRDEAIRALQVSVHKTTFVERECVCVYVCVCVCVRMCECVLVEEKREKERDECGAGKRAEIEGEVWASFGLEGAGKTPNTLCGIGAKMITNVTMLVNVTMFEMYAMQTQSAFGEQEMETACAEGIAWCPVYTVCTVSSVYSVQCIQCPVCPVSSVQCIQCPMYTVSSVYSVQCPVCTVYTVSSVSSVQCIQCPVSSVQ